MILADWCVLLAMMLPWMCAAYGKYQGGGFTPQANRNPRHFFANAEGVVARANAAQNNGYEIFAPFAFAVLLAQYTGQASPTTINTIAVIFILSRLIYILCYLSDKASLRSFTWGIGLMCILALFFAAL